MMVVISLEMVSHPKTRGSRYSLSCCGIHERSCLRRKSWYRQKFSVLNQLQNIFRRQLNFTTAQGCVSVLPEKKGHHSFSTSAENRSSSFRYVKRTYLKNWGNVVKLPPT